MIAFLVNQGMTLAEARVVEGVLKGWANKEVACHLHIAEKTVKFHLTKVYKKLKVKSRSELMSKFLVISPAVLLQSIKDPMVPVQAEQVY